MQYLAMGRLMDVGYSLIITTAKDAECSDITTQFNVDTPNVLTWVSFGPKSTLFVAITNILISDNFLDFSSHFEYQCIEKDLIFQWSYVWNANDPPNANRC